jgi:hypothetical protein
MNLCQAIRLIELKRTTTSLEKASYGLHHIGTQDLPKRSQTRYHLIASAARFQHLRNAAEPGTRTMQWIPHRYACTSMIHGGGWLRSAFRYLPGYGYGRDNQSGRACWEKQWFLRKMPDEGSRRTHKLEFIMKRNAIKSFLFKTFH